MAENKYYGKYRAKVVDVNDPERRGRIRVQCPAVLGTYKSAWCEPCIPYATDYAGDYYVPPINEGIWIEFEEGDVNKPIWNGGWYRTDSTPLLPTSKPEDYRFISFKNSIIHMRDKEIIFEFRNGDNTSSVLKFNPETLIGLAYISSLTGEQLNDVGNLIANTNFVLVENPSTLQSNINLVQSNLDTFANQTCTARMNEVIKTVNELKTKVSTIENTLNAITDPITGLQAQINSLRTQIDDLASKI